MADTPAREFDTVVMGRATHQVAVDEGLASGYPHLRQYVVTHRPEDLPAEDGLSASDEDPVDLVRRLKSEDSRRDIWLCGGGRLAGRVADEIDEFRLKINPVILGEGIPLLAASPTDPREQFASASSAAPTGSSVSAGGASSGLTGEVPLGVRQQTRQDFESGVSYVEYTRA